MVSMVEVPQEDPRKPTLFGRVTQAWIEYLRKLNEDVDTIESVRIHREALADQPTLGTADAGYLLFVTDYGHLVRWTGTAGEFAPGDVGNRFLRFFVGAPQDGTFWQLADGTATTFLTVGGATLTTTAFTTPNITAGTFVKVLAAYTGTIEAAIAPALSGATGGTAPALTGSTAAEASHTHNTGNLNHAHSVLADHNTTGPSATTTVDQTLAGATVAVASDTHTHPITENITTEFTNPATTTGVGSSHLHAAGTLAVDSHTHPVGTLVGDTAARPPSLGLLAYFRR